MSPALRFASCRLKLIPCVERTIEKPHSLVNLKANQKNVQGPFVSLSARMPEVMDDFQRDPSYLQRLETAYEEADGPKAIVELVGLHHHPAWVGLPRRQCGREAHMHKQLQVCAQMIYRYDLEGMFASYAGARKQHESVKGATANRLLRRVRAAEAPPRIDYEHSD